MFVANSIGKNAKPSLSIILPYFPGIGEKAVMGEVKEISGIIGKKKIALNSREYLGSDGNSVREMSLSMI